MAAQATSFWLFKQQIKLPVACTCLLSLQALVAVLMFLINSCIQGGVQASLDSKQMVLQGHACKGKDKLWSRSITKHCACALQCRQCTKRIAMVAKHAGKSTQQQLSTSCAAKQRLASGRAT
jgi:hypothetical protein